MFINFSLQSFNHSVFGYLWLSLVYFWPPQASSILGKYLIAQYELTPVRYWHYIPRFGVPPSGHRNHLGVGGNLWKGHVSEPHPRSLRMRLRHLHFSHVWGRDSHMCGYYHSYYLNILLRAGVTSLFICLVFCWRSFAPQTSFIIETYTHP